ncbi:hypothetical protein CcCBS67573_g01773 [Chytriomyces confervae]|uniref:RNI-like protein n=1 Tax=Chytriomyces confervae TaxID=246404 RepID=A0A507FKV0_9FUNG|nr:NLR, CARD domain-containing protein 3 [Chytriomyces hyalinus]TPX76944.1 hypothetical protein CcCBS67573_g01773 [Chytriomyces confervae]
MAAKAKAASAGGKKKKKGGKDGKMSAKKKKGQEVDEEATKLRKETLNRIKASYPIHCKKFLTEPIPSVVKRIDKSIQALEDIDKVLVSNYTLTPSDVWALYSTFESYSVLAAFYLWTSPVDARGLDALSKLIIRHPTVTTLHLIDCKITPPMATHIRNLVRESKTLTTLVLDHNGIGSAGAVEVFTGIRENTASPGLLKILSMKYCDIDARAADAISYTIAMNPGLTLLDLSGNFIGDEGLSAIAKSLATNTNLKNFNLSANNIQNRADENVGPISFMPTNSGRPGTNPAPAAVPRLPPKTSITILCNILATENTGLNFLDLSGNHVGVSGGEAILEMLKMRKPLVAAKKCEALQVEITERVREELYGDVCDLNDVMDELAKKNAKGAAKGKKGKKGK